MYIKTGLSDREDFFASKETSIDAGGKRSTRSVSLPMGTLYLNDHGIVGKIKFEKGIKLSLNQEKFNIISGYIRNNLKKTKNFKFETTSYGLKHLVERSVGFYVSNGQLIYVMLQLGYDCCLILNGDKYSLNCHFNVTRMK